jgi:hypothetical protein
MASLGIISRSLSQTGTHATSISGPIAVSDEGDGPLGPKRIRKIIFPQARGILGVCCGTVCLDT